MPEMVVCSSVSWFGCCRCVKLVTSYTMPPHRLWLLLMNLAEVQFALITCHIESDS